MNTNKNDIEKYNDIDILIDDRKSSGMSQDEIDKLTEETFKDPEFQELLKTLK